MIETSPAAAFLTTDGVRMKPKSTAVSEVSTAGVGAGPRQPARCCRCGSPPHRACRIGDKKRSQEQQLMPGPLMRRHLPLPHPHPSHYYTRSPDLWRDPPPPQGLSRCCTCRQSQIVARATKLSQIPRSCRRRPSSRSPADPGHNLRVRGHHLPRRDWPCCLRLRFWHHQPQPPS